MALKFEGLSRIPAKQKVFLAGLLSVMLCAAYYYVFYKPAAAETVKLQGQLADLESKIKEQAVIARNLPSFRAEVGRLETQLSLLLDQLPNSAEIPTLLKNISDMGKESGLEFVKFTPRPEAAKQFYAEIPVNISVEGGFHDFAIFADKLGHLPRIVNLSDISFSQPKLQAPDRMRVGVTCSATTYRFLEQAPPPKPAPAAKGVKGGKK
jgi:type IV pilus assembly protein PilO